MQLTRAADYAVRVMIHLAGLPPGTRVSRSELSAAAECPEQFLCKVLQNLTRAGLVDLPSRQHRRVRARGTASHRLRPRSGRGRRRTHPPQPLPDQRSRLHPPGLVPRPRRLGRSAQAAMLQVLKDANISDLAEQAAAGAPPRRRRHRRSPMELTWIAILASLCMALAAVCIFIFAVKKDYFHNIEDTKYQVFWSDLEELVDTAPQGEARSCPWQARSR